jgi:hypothetical protein
MDRLAQTRLIVEEFPETVGSTTISQTQIADGFLSRTTPARAVT